MLPVLAAVPAAIASALTVRSKVLRPAKPLKSGITRSQSSMARCTMTRAIVASAPNIALKSSVSPAPAPVPLLTQLTTDSIRRVSSGSNCATARHARRRVERDLNESNDDDDERADVGRDIKSPFARPIGGNGRRWGCGTKGDWGHEGRFLQGSSGC